MESTHFSIFDTVFANWKFWKDPKQKTPFRESTYLETFQHRETNAVAFSGPSSPKPGVITIANAVFGSKSQINLNVLANAFRLDKNIVIFSDGLLK
ncbi:hypothetical protein V6N13_064073 [Hibiscus sabdariffa]